MSFEALDLALALHAAPGRIDELRARALPGNGMAALLRVALAQPDALADAGAAFPADAARLVDAARFFIEQQLLAREFDHDPWRVLGVNPGAAPALIRAHHHLLVRLVHPDRSDDWASAYADRVNRAWRQLRDADGHPAVMPRSVPPVVVESWDAHAARPQLRSSNVVSTPAAAPNRSRPAFWIAAGAFIAVAATVLWQQWHVDAIEVPTQSNELVTPATPWYAESHLPDPLREAAPLPAIVPIADLDTASVVPAPMPATAVPIMHAPEAPHPPPRPVVVAAAPQPAAIAPAAAAPAIGLAVKPTTTPVAEPTVVASVSAPSADDATDAVAAAVPQLDAQSGATLLRQFRERYAQGDINGLLRLYAREVHTDARSVANIAGAYTRLFNSSQQRYIDFSEVRWQQQNNRVLGHARYEVGYRKRPSLLKYLERGEVELELILDGSESRLRRFDLHADRRR